MLFPWAFSWIITRILCSKPSKFEVWAFKKPVRYEQNVKINFHSKVPPIDNPVALCVRERNGLLWVNLVCRHKKRTNVKSVKILWGSNKRFLYKAGFSKNSRRMIPYMYISGNNLELWGRFLMKKQN